MFTLTFAPIKMFYNISLDSNLDPKDRPKGFYLYFLSNNTWLALVDSTWPQFKPTKEYIDFSEEYTAMYLSAREKIFKVGEEDNLQCYTDLLSKYKCDSICGVMTHSYHPLCNTSDQLNCIWNKLWADTR